MSEYLSVYLSESSNHNLSPEMFSRLDLANATYGGLLRALENHRSLGEAGRAKDVENQFGETTLRADLEAEQQVLKSVEDWATRRQASVTFRGEEIAEGVIGEEHGKKYFMTVDGLDGSANYLEACEWSYGTMVSISEGENPRYEDFQVAGIALPEEGWIILAIKDLGVFVTDIESGKTIKLPRFEKVEYDEAKVLADNYFPEAKKMLGQRQGVWPRTGSFAATITALATRDFIVNKRRPKMNEAWQGLADVTRKGNLEQPIAYLILSELGGVVVDKNGRNIGEYLFADWGQEEKTPIILAINPKIAQEILARLNL